MHMQLGKQPDSPFLVTSSEELWHTFVLRDPIFFLVLLWLLSPPPILPSTSWVQNQLCDFPYRTSRGLKKAMYKEALPWATHYTLKAAESGWWDGPAGKALVRILPPNPIGRWKEKTSPAKSPSDLHKHALEFTHAQAYTCIAHILKKKKLRLERWLIG